MNLGVVFPQPALVDRESIKEFAQAAESLGFAHILSFDHVLGGERSDRTPPLWGPYGSDDPFHEPLTLFAFLAGVTEHLEFCTGVLVLPQRQAALVAKQAAEIAILSDDRLRLGVGVGWNYVEYEGLGADFKTRGRRQEDQIRVLRELWSEELVTYRSRWHNLDRVSIEPRPNNPIPIWLGGFTPVAHERAVRLADGFIFGRTAADTADGSLRNQLSIAQRMLDRVEKGGRDPKSFGLEGRLNYFDSPAVWSRQYEEMAANGFSHATINLARSGIGDVRACVTALSTISAELGLVPGRFVEERR